MDSRFRGNDCAVVRPRPGEYGTTLLPGFAWRESRPAVRGMYGWVTRGTCAFYPASASSAACAAASRAIGTR